MIHEPLVALPPLVADDLEAAPRRVVIKLNPGAALPSPQGNPAEWLVTLLGGPPAFQIPAIIVRSLFAGGAGAGSHDLAVFKQLVGRAAVRDPRYHDLNGAVNGTGEPGAFLERYLVLDFLAPMPENVLDKLLAGLNASGRLACDAYAQGGDLPSRVFTPASPVKEGAPALAAAAPAADPRDALHLMSGSGDAIPSGTGPRGSRAEAGSGDRSVRKPLEIVGCTDQGYLEAAPQGIDARYAWSLRGGDGGGVRIVDLEKGWELQNAGLIDSGITLIAGSNQGDSLSRPHGTWVLGVLAATAKDRGIQGIAYGAGSVRVVSLVEDPANPSFLNTPKAILQAVAELRFGDVLLLEDAIPPRSGGWAPVEADPSIFDAIRLATAYGIVVIEPASNDPDPASVPEVAAALRRQRGGVEDSQAILVGAASSEAPHARKSDSAYGSRIDSYAWGQSVCSLTVEMPSIEGGINLGAGAAMTATSSARRSVVKTDTSFGDTSAAAAIIAGAAVLLQGLAYTHRRFRFSPGQIRLILGDRENGTASGDGDQFPIGVMPDLKKIVGQVLNLTPAPYLRDHVGDIGCAGSGGGAGERRWASPEIVLAAQSAVDPQQAFGEGSGTEDMLVGGVPGLPSRYAYVRLRNRGGADAAGVEIKLYSSPVSSCPLPVLWELHATAALGAVRHGDLLAVSREIGLPERGGPRTWIALCGDEQAPMPVLPATWEDLLHLVGSQRFACRNLHVVEHASEVCPNRSGSYLCLPFKACGAPDRHLNMHLEVIAQLPVAACVWLAMPPAIADLEGIWGDPSDVLGDDTNNFIPVNPNGRHPIRECIFERGVAHDLQLVVYIPSELRRDPYCIAVRQVADGLEVGRVSWRLVPRPAGTSAVRF